MDDALRARLAALRTAYGVTLPAQVEDLDHAVKRWQSAPKDTALATQAASIAHRLCGTSGSFGFPEISAAAKAVETLVHVNADALDTLRVADEMRRLAAAAAKAAEGPA